MTAPHNQNESAARPIGNYEIKFALWSRAQDWAGIFPGVAFISSQTGPGYADCAVILPAYSAEDCLTDFWIRITNCGWRRENVRVISITPAQSDRPEPQADRAYGLTWEAAQKGEQT